MGQIFVVFSEYLTFTINSRWIAYSAGVKYGAAEDWNFAWKMYNTTQVASERNLWLRALAASTDPYILQQ